MEQKTMISVQQKPFTAPAFSPEGTVVARMAQFMLESAEGVDEPALVRAGFTRAEINKHSAEAIDLANITGRAS